MANRVVSDDCYWVEVLHYFKSPLAVLENLCSKRNPTLCRPLCHMLLPPLLPLETLPNDCVSRPP